jgi:hypothetical membrane protein
MAAEESLKNRINKFFLGKYSGEFLKKVLGPISAIIFALSIGISWALYPDYDWTQMDVSYLGSPYRNPAGWIFWSVGMFLTGIIMFTIVGYIRRKLVPIFKIHAKIGVLFFYLSSFGMILLGLIPQFKGGIFADLHFANALFAFGGLYFGTWTFCFHMLINEGFRKKALIMAALAFGSTTFLIVTQSLRLLAFPPNSEIPNFLDFSLSEWVLLFGIFGAFTVFLLNLPKDDIE